MISRDVCTDPAGQFHECAAEGSTLWINGVAFPQRQAPLFPRIASNGAVSLVAYKGHEDGVVALQASNGNAASLESSHGNQPVAIEDYEGDFSVEIAHYETASVWTIDGHVEVMRGPSFQDTNPNKGASGFLDWGIWTDPNRNIEVETVNAGRQRLTLPMRRGAWTVGQANVGPDQVAVFNHNTSMIFTIWIGSTQLPPRIAVSGAQLRVAISAEGVDRLFTEADLRPFDTAFQAPPFSVEKMQRPMAVGCFFSTKEAPGNCVLFPRGIDLRADMTEDGPSKPLPALWVDREDDKSLEDVIARDREWADALSIPLAVYVDGDWRDPAGLLPTDIRMVNGYRAKGESVNAFRARLWDNMTAASGPHNHQFMIVAGAYDRNGDLSESEMAECFPIYEEAWRIKSCVGIAFFAWDRANGAAKYVWLKDYIKAFADASPGLPNFTLPAPVDPPTPDPPDPVYEEPMSPETVQQSHERLAVRIFGMKQFDGYDVDEAVKAVRTIMDTLGRVPTEYEAVKATPLYAIHRGGGQELTAWADARKANANGGL